MSYYGKNIGHGLAGERMVWDFFTANGIGCEESTPHENKMLDIDLYCTVGDEFQSIGIEPGTHSVSVKRNDEGKRYGNICFELLQQERAVLGDTRTDLERWTKTGWFNTGKAAIYAIIQQRDLYLYAKSQIIDYVTENGWLRTRRLTWQRKDALMRVPGYRFDDSLCGYLNTEAPNHIHFLMP